MSSNKPFEKHPKKRENICPFKLNLDKEIEGVIYLGIPTVLSTNINPNSAQKSEQIQPQTATAARAGCSGCLRLYLSGFPSAVRIYVS